MWPTVFSLVLTPWRTEGGHTPLHMAAGFSESPAIVVALLDAGAGVKARGADGLEPVHFAAWSNKNPAVITALLNAGANFNAQAGLREGLLEELEKSLGTGADINTPTEGKITPLTPIQLGVMSNHDLGVISGLLSGPTGPTPLQFAAAFSENFGVIAALLDAGADVSRNFTVP